VAGFNAHACLNLQLLLYMYMKKIFLFLLLGTVALRSLADEGMWLPLLLGQATYNDMVKKGCKLKKEEIFNLNQKSIKDAIVIFGGGCTGEMVSNKGLLFTNHHCGYDAIAGLSSVENNYLQNGYFAADEKGELVAKGVTVQFLLNIKDVTEEIMAKLGDLKGAERIKKQAEIIAEINKANSDPSKFIEARASSFFKGNQYLLFTYVRYGDVRFVGCPPESLGKYGGDTDNWMWPRHTNDFSVFRVYGNADGSPTKEYDANNVPFKPKHHLPVSLAGVKENDFNMILGYPGSTNRFEVSYGARMSRDYSNPAYVNCRDIRLKMMKAQMDKDPAVRLKLASNYAGLANYWKFFDLESKQLRSRKVVEQKEDMEVKFQKWAMGKPEFQNILENYSSNYNNWISFEELRNYMSQGIYGNTVNQLAGALLVARDLMRKGDDKSIESAKKIVANVDKNFENTWAATDATTEKNILASIAHAFYKNVEMFQQPKEVYQTIEGYGSLNDEATYAKYAQAIFDNSILTDVARWKAFAANPTLDALEADLGFAGLASYADNWNNNYKPKYDAFVTANNDLGRAWVKGLRLMNSTKNYYPDANFSMRFTYGTVKGYEPRDAVKYDFVTTATGLLDKYIPGDQEFGLQNNIVDLIKKKDYGRYKDAKRNDLVTCFLNTCDITGGNSGSPVLNGKGELIGLAFDGNSESMDQKLNFYGPQTRCICVDIRFVLWCIEKVGGGKRVVDELTYNK
jgi:hypothetical protein